jgi:hypothetical protein
MSDEPNFLSRWSRRKVQARQGVALAEPPAPVSELVVVAAVAPAAEAVALPAQSVDATTPHTETPDATKPPPPTLADVATLTRESDFSRFVAPGVDGEVKNAALKKLFADPRFNVMDGLDTYIDDYSKPDPLPASMLRKMAQAAFLGLVEPEPPAAAGAAAVPDAAAGPAASPDAAAGAAATLEAATATAAASSTAQAPNAEVEPAAPCSDTTPEPDENTDLRLQPHDAAGCSRAESSAAADIERQP